MTKVVPFAPIVDLGEEKVEDINDRMIRGESISSIVRVIHEDWQVLPEMKAPALHKMLSRYRLSVVKPEQKQHLIELVEARKPAALAKSLNALNELEKAILLQWERVQKWQAQQQQMGLPIKDMREDLRLLKEMLRDLGMLQLETGILKRAPKTTLGEFFGADGSRGAFIQTEVWDEAMQELEHMDLMALPGPDNEVIDVTSEE